MRLPRVQFTLPRLMMLVALLATSFGVAAAVERRADYCRQRVRAHRRIIGCGTVFGIPALDEPTNRHKALIRDYEYAMWRPWIFLPIEPVDLK